MYAVIMAGGSGTRFWPLSRRHQPKQLLPFFGERPMIADAVARIAPLVPASHILIVTSDHLVQPVRETLPELPPDNIIAEPVGRNTAPCIGLATHLIQARGGHEDPLIGVFAADHYVAQPDTFRNDVHRAYQAADSPGTIVTLGIVPTRPETGYGYLKVGPNDGSQTASAVERFVEKPDATTATTYLADGNYLWNAGLFFFRASTMLAEFDRQLPELATTLRQIRADLTTDRAQDTLHRLFPTLASVSIDYGIMEGAQDVRVIPTQCGWSDVGHWDALPDLLPADGLGNILQGDTIAHDTHDTIVLNQHDDHLVALVGVHNLVVVTTDDATLVLPRSRAQEVRAIVKALQNARRDDLL